VALVGAGQSCVELKQYDEAEKYLDQALAIVQPLMKAKSPEMTPAVVSIMISLVQAISSPQAFDGYAQCH
jgi:hypothetical protein